MHVHSSLAFPARFRASLVAVAMLACAGSGPLAAPTVAATASGTYFDEVWAQYDARYPFFAAGGIDWERTAVVYRDSVAQAKDDRTVARLVGAMIGTLNDHHAELTTPFGVFGPPRIAYEHHYSPALVSRTYLAAGLKLTPSGRIAFGRMGDVGYVVVASFEGTGWGGEIENALGALGAVSALIVDIRDNGGGNEDNGLDIAARFTTGSHVYRLSRQRTGRGYDDLSSPTSMSYSPAGSHRFTGPIALITNRFNGSSAEDFTLMLRVLPNVVTVGDTTLGLGSNPLRLTLPNGWSYRVPQTMQMTPDGFVYQWKGLPPMATTAWTAADTSAGRDPYIELALRRLEQLGPR